MLCLFESKTAQTASLVCLWAFWPCILTRIAWVGVLVATIIVVWYNVSMMQNKANWRTEVYCPAVQKTPDDWEFVRLERLVLDHNQCQRCKSPCFVTVHHIVPRDQGGSDAIENLITLCTKCHDEVECIGLYTRRQIEHSYDSPSLVEIDPLPDTDWHTWVYGSARNPNK